MLGFERHRLCPCSQVRSEKWVANRDRGTTQLQGSPRTSDAFRLQAHRYMALVELNPHCASLNPRKLDQPTTASCPNLTCPASPTTIRPSTVRKETRAPIMSLK